MPDTEIKPGEWEDDQLPGSTATGEVGQFVVTCDHHYYESVSYYATREEADDAARQVELADRHDTAGRSYHGHQPRVIVAQILAVTLLRKRD
jgi:hypothetical protein